MKILKPKFWDQNYFTVTSLLLLPFTIFYKFILILKKIFSNPEKFQIKVICVGNIYIGGTGKTPLSLKICKILKNLNQKPVIIKKDYKNQNDEINLIKKYNKILIKKKKRCN